MLETSEIKSLAEKTQQQFTGKFGYAAGIVSKLTNTAYMADFGKKWYVLFFYCLNFIMVGTDMILYFRNKKLDAQRDAEAAGK